MKRSTLLILIICVLLAGYLGWLGTLGLRAEEPRRAIVSYEMMASGDLVMPRLLGWAYYNKPPLFNWVMILFYKLFGSFSEWVVRLPSTLSLLLLAFMNWKIVSKHINREVALLSSLFLLTSADILFYGSVNAGELDLFFTLLVYLNIMVLFGSLEKGKYLLLFTLSYFMAALGFLTKGMPALPFQVLTLAASLIYFKKARLLISWKHLAGILVFTLVVGGYLYLLSLRETHTAFLFRQFKEAAQRTGIESGFTDNLIGIATSPITVVKLLLPWSLFIPLIFLKGVRNKLTSNGLITFSMLFILVNFPVYWITGELRDRYLYPFIPFLCIILAYAFSLQHGQPGWFNKILDYFFGGAIVLFPVALLIAFFIPAIHFNLINGLICGVLIAAGATLAYRYIRYHTMRIYLVILMLGLAKIAMNITYMPLYKAESETTYHKEQVHTILGIIGNEDLQITGTPESLHFSLKFAGVEYLTEQVILPLSVSYQIPYYYARITDKTLEYTLQPKKDKYYLVPGFDLKKYPGELLHQYMDMSTKNEFFLIRYKGPGRRMD